MSHHRAAFAFVGTAIHRRRTAFKSVGMAVDRRRTALNLVVAAALSCGPSSAWGQSGTDLCLDAERFVSDVVGMVAVVEPDTIDDWRTRAMVPGCRVTAAGATRRPDAVEARDFYERIREAGWMRTPDPRDAPNEASLRFRRGGADCLFNYYTLVSPLDTEAELRASDAVFLSADERLFNILVMCTPAAPAAPRGSSLH